MTGKNLTADKESCSLCVSECIYRTFALLRLFYSLHCPCLESLRAHLHVVGMSRFMFFDINQPSLPIPFHSVLVPISVYGPFNCISFHKLSAFSPCSSGLISAFLVLSTIYLCMNVSFRPDIILCGFLGLRHQLTDLLFLVANKSSALFPFLFPSPGPHISSSSFC